MNKLVSTVLAASLSVVSCQPVDEYVPTDRYEAAAINAGLPRGTYAKQITPILTEFGRVDSLEFWVLDPQTGVSVRDVRRALYNQDSGMLYLYLIGGNEHPNETNPFPDKNIYTGAALPKITIPPIQ